MAEFAPPADRQDFESRNMRDVFADAERRLKGHSIQRLFEVGLYRHYRCRNNGSSNDGFDIVTWPGSLMYTGDMGEYLFQRTDDMIAFMRGSLGSHSYVAEKCMAHGSVRSGSGVSEFREEVFEEVLADRLQEAIDDGIKEPALGELREKLSEIRDACNDDQCDPAFAFQAIHDSGLWDGSDFPNCTTYTFRFLWCLRALRWFVDTLDKKE